MELKEDLMLWAGNEESLGQYVEALKNATIVAVNNPQALIGMSKNEDNPMLSVANGVARIAIKGPLSNSDNPYLAFYGIVTYASIRDALMRAVNDTSVNAILLDVHSGGGQVAGVSDTARLISQINKSVKTVYAYTDGAMHSAAMWLGASAEKVFASDVAEVGSIGVLVVHIDQSAMLKDMKIKATIVRSGKYKALVNPYEPLSKVALDNLQSKVDTVDKIFVSHIADMRGVSYDVAKEKMADGREFMASEAVDVGLIDGVSSYDAVMGGLISKQKNLDKSKGLINNRMKSKFGADNTMTTKPALTEAQIAALAEGGVELSAEQIAAAAAETKAAEDKAAADKLAAETKAAEDKAAADKLAAAKPEGDLVAYLRAQIVDKDAALIEATISLRDAKAQVAAMEGAHKALVVIAAESVNKMRVALGGSATDLSAAAAEAVLVQHAEATAAFKAKFKVGGVAAVSAAAEKTEPAKPAAVHKARIAATRTPK